MDILKNKKTKNFLIYGFGQAINILGPLLVLPFLIQVCGVEKVGKIGVGFSLALILNGIIDYGSYINGVKDISINRNNKSILEDKFTSIYLSKFILFTIILILISSAILIIPYLSKDKNLFFFSLSIVLGQLLNPAWFFQGIENFKWLSFLNIFSKLIYLFLVFFLVSEVNDYVFVNFFLGLGAVIANLFGFVWLIKSYSFSFKSVSISSGLAIIKEEFSFSLSQFFLSLYQFFPIIIISFLAGDFLAGQFKIIDQIISLFKTYLNMFFYFIYANICFELHKSFKNGIDVWKKANGISFLLLLVLIVFFFLFAPIILQFFKIDTLQQSSMVSNFRLALIIPFLISISLPLRQLMFAFNFNKIYIRITIVTTIFNFILLFIFTKYADLFGAFLSIIFIELIVIFLYVLVLVKNKNKKIKNAF
jgi:O-antigen/teichoic acid export membrane protein